jgi:hypothetical protein
MTGHYFDQVWASHEWEDFEIYENGRIIYRCKRCKTQAGTSIKYGRWIALSSYCGPNGRELINCKETLMARALK